MREEGWTAVNRKTFDVLMATAGLVVAAVLVVAGSLLVWGHQFAASNVRSQLVAQKIYFPAKGNAELADPKVGPHLNRNAGQQLTNGAQAKAYADHFIAVHLQKIGGGRPTPSCRPRHWLSRPTRPWPTRSTRSSRARPCAACS